MNAALELVLRGPTPMHHLATKTIDTTTPSALPCFPGYPIAFQLWHYHVISPFGYELLALREGVVRNACRTSEHDNKLLLLQLYSGAQFVVRLFFSNASAAEVSNSCGVSPSQAFVLAGGT